jgi:hypothetical protein
MVMIYLNALPPLFRPALPVESYTKEIQWKYAGTEVAQPV